MCPLRPARRVRKLHRPPPLDLSAPSLLDPPEATDGSMRMPTRTPQQLLLQVEELEKKANALPTSGSPEELQREHFRLLTEVGILKHRGVPLLKSDQWDAAGTSSPGSLSPSSASQSDSQRNMGDVSMRSRLWARVQKIATPAPVARKLQLMRTNSLSSENFPVARRIMMRNNSLSSEGFRRGTLWNSLESESCNEESDGGEHKVLQRSDSNSSKSSQLDSAWKAATTSSSSSSSCSSSTSSCCSSSSSCSSSASSCSCAACSASASSPSSSKMIDTHQSERSSRSSSSSSSSSSDKTKKKKSGFLESAKKSGKALKNASSTSISAMIAFSITSKWKIWKDPPKVIVMDPVRPKNEALSPVPSPPSVVCPPSPCISDRLPLAKNTRLWKSFTFLSALGKPAPVSAPDELDTIEHRLLASLQKCRISS